MKRRVTPGKIVGTVICGLIFIGGVVVIALSINADTAFPAIGGILLAAFGGGLTLSIWFPFDGAVKTYASTESEDERNKRKAQRKAERDMFFAAMLVDDAVRSRNKEKDKRENVWEDNSEDNDDADPDNW